MQNLFKNKIILSLLIILVNIFFVDISHALGVNFHLPWSIYESYIVTQGNGGTFSHQGKTYYAWDFAMSEGTIIRASASGKVIKVESAIPGYLPKSWGNYIIIDHGNGIYSRYAHLQRGSIYLTPGTQVKQGQVIGRSGNTGNSTGPHLHYQVENKAGFSIPSTFIEVGVPLVYQKVTSQNNGQENSVKQTQSVDYKRLYAILSSDEFKKSEENLKGTASSPTEKFLESSLKNKNEDKKSFLNDARLYMIKLLRNQNYKLLSLAFFDIPCLTLLTSSYFFIKFLALIKL